MNETTAWLTIPPAPLDEQAMATAIQHQGQLTKPPGALGRLEEIAIRLAAMQGHPRPTLERIQIVLFAGDHGVTAEGISAFPPAVTAEMVRNFARGGAAINVLARQIGAPLEVINLGTLEPLEPIEGVTQLPLGPGTANFTRQPAMDPFQLARALHMGRHSAERARRAGAQLFIGGEMGIGNTTAAAALACALLEEAPTHLVGPGTGLPAARVAHKRRVVERALSHHRAHLNSPVEALRRLGGFEIAGLTGALLACAHIGLPVLVDGFICSVAALTAARLCEGAEQWFLFAHRSAEPGHGRVLAALAAEPLLDLEMRLGEGSGAALAVPLLQAACRLHGEMATFATAGVSAAS